MDQKSRPTSILEVTIKLTIRLYKRFVFAGNNLSPKRAYCLENVSLII